MKILILASYYCRPLLVKNMLRSLKEADRHHQNWHMVLGDDNSPDPHGAQAVVDKEMRGYESKITVINSNMTFEEKAEIGISLGKFANSVMKESDADIVLTIGDDDEFCPFYLKELSLFYEQNPDVLYAYSNIILYNPLIQKSKDVTNLWNKYNQWREPINPVNKVDATQVSWRLSCCKKHGAWFRDSTKSVEDMPWAKDTDKSFFENLYEKCGPAHPTNLCAQYKGVHDHQLLWHKKADVQDLRKYDENIRSLAGKLF